MRIWKAELVLFHDKEYVMDFSFELQDQEFEVNEYNNNEWTHYKDWVMDRIPMNMTLERYYDNYKIIKGFNYELNEEELKKLEKDMRDSMEKQLNYDKELFLKEYENKLKVIQG